MATAESILERIEKLEARRESYETKITEYIEKIEALEVEIDLAYEDLALAE